MNFLKSKYGTDDPKEIVKIKQDNPCFSRDYLDSVIHIKDMTAAKCKDLCKKSGLEYLEGYEGRVIQYTLTSEKVDRYGDIVKADGVDLTNYKKNPVVMTFHDYHQFPVGNAIKVWYDSGDRKVKAFILFFDDRVDRSGLSELAFRYANSGAMKTGSIGFRILESYYPEDSEREKLKMPKHGMVFTKSDLLEFTVCPVPANTDAHRDAVKRGFFTKNNLDYAADKGIFKEDNYSTIHDTIEELIDTVKEADKNKTEDNEDINNKENSIEKAIEKMELSVNTFCTSINCLQHTISELTDKIDDGFGLKEDSSVHNHSSSEDKNKDVPSEVLAALDSIKQCLKK